MGGDDDDMMTLFVILSMVHVMRVVIVIVTGVSPLLLRDEDEDGSATICENARVGRRQWTWW